MIKTINSEGSKMQIPAGEILALPTDLKVMVALTVDGVATMPTKYTIYSHTSFPCECKYNPIVDGKFISHLAFKLYEPIEGVLELIYDDGKK